jgi:hypothetical protein
MKRHERLMCSIEIVAFRLLAARWFASRSLDRLLGSLSSARRDRQGQVPPEALAHDLTLVESILGRTPLPGTCLYLALARYAMLARHGYGPCFVLGIDPRGLSQPGHAWIELTGTPFAERFDVSRYHVTYRYPAVEEERSVRE